MGMSPDTQQIGIEVAALEKSAIYSLLRHDASDQHSASILALLDRSGSSDGKLLLTRAQSEFLQNLAQTVDSANYSNTNPAIRRAYETLKSVASRLQTPPELDQERM